MSRIIVKNIPKSISEQKFRQHFEQKGEVTDAKIMRSQSGLSRGFGFIGYKSEQQCLDAISFFNNTYLGSVKIQVERALGKTQEEEYSVQKEETQQKPKINIEKKLQEFLSLREKMQNWKESLNPEPKKKKIQKQEEQKTEGKQYADVEQEFDTSRLFIRNLSYQVTEQELRDLFEKFGSLQEITLLRDKNERGIGIAYVKFQDVQEAVTAFGSLDNTVFQGRLLHILPSKKKKEVVQQTF